MEVKNNYHPLDRRKQTEMATAEVHLTEEEQNRLKRTRPELQAQTEELIEQRVAIVERLRELEGKDELDKREEIERRRLKRELDHITTQLLNLHQGLATKYAAKFRSHKGVNEDYKAAAQLGLMRAIDTYDPSKGSSFSTWAHLHIKRETIGAVQAFEHSTMSKSDFDQRQPVLRAIRLLRQNNPSYDPTDEEVAAEAGVPVEKVARIRNSIVNTSLDSPVGSESDSEGAVLSDLIEDISVDVEAQVITSLALENLAEFGLDELDHRERLTLVRRLGLDGEPIDKLHTVGLYLGVSREAARNLETKALSKLNHPALLYQLAPGARRHAKYQRNRQQRKEAGS